MIKTKRKVRTGVVISDKMKKTIIVRVQRLTKHPIYAKVVRKTNKFKVHDEKNIAKIGDIVRIVETRPLSKDKRFRLVEVIKKGQPDLLLEPAEKSSQQ